MLTDRIKRTFTGLKEKRAHKKEVQKRVKQTLKEEAAALAEAKKKQAVIDEEITGKIKEELLKVAENMNLTLDEVIEYIKNL